MHHTNDKTITMELKKSHREALITKLESVNEKIELNKSISLGWHNAKEDEKQTAHLVDWHDMDLFLFQEEKKLIEKSLIDNDIDF